MPDHYLWAQTKDAVAYGAALKAGCAGVGAALETGWAQGQYSRKRFWWDTPWSAMLPSRSWRPGWERMQDSWCNPIIAVTLPLRLGVVAVRYGPRPFRTRVCDMCILESRRKVCRYCGTMECESLPAKEEES